MDWYPWYFTIFKTATRHMTPLQRGLYRELIDEYMSTREPLPDDDYALATICRCTLEIWSENSDKIRAKFEQNSGVLSHRFCDEILSEQDKISNTKSKSAKKAALTRWKEKKKPIMRDAYVTHTSRNADAMRENATGQDRTGQKKKEERTGQSGLFPEIEKPTETNNDNPPWYEGKLIKLNRKDFEKWLAVYGGTYDQFFDYLNDRDKWLFAQSPEKRKNWFMSTKKHIESLKESP